MAPKKCVYPPISVRHLKKKCVQPPIVVHVASVTLTKLADKTYVEIISTDFLVWLVAESNFEQSYIEKK